MTALLSTPNSLASSYTRTLATSLLLGPGCAGPSLLHGRTHRVLIECSSQSRPTSDSRGTRAARGFRTALLTVLHARQSGEDPPCRALPGPERPGKRPDGEPPGRYMPGWDAHTHPGRAAYRADRGDRLPAPSPYAAERSWPLAPDTPHRCVQGTRGYASDQTLLSLPPRAALTPLGQESNGRLLFGLPRSCTFDGSMRTGRYRPVRYGADWYVVPMSATLGRARSSWRRQGCRGVTRTSLTGQRLGGPSRPAPPRGIFHGAAAEAPVTQALQYGTVSPALTSSLPGRQPVGQRGQPGRPCRHPVLDRLAATGRGTAHRTTLPFRSGRAGFPCPVRPRAPRRHRAPRRPRFRRSPCRDGCRCASR